MITLEQLHGWSKLHGIDNGKRVALENDNLLLSIVGGRPGLYGDFEKDFEMAILDKSTDEFVTKMFVTSNDDVLPYQDIKQVSEIIEMLFSKTGFRVL